jgi:hypothetical protein
VKPKIVQLVYQKALQLQMEEQKQAPTELAATQQAATPMAATPVVWSDAQQPVQTTAELMPSYPMTSIQRLLQDLCLSCMMRFPAQRLQ